MAEIIIRRVEQGDLPALLDIYNHYVRETPVTFDLEPRTLAQRQEWLDISQPPAAISVSWRSKQARRWAGPVRTNSATAPPMTLRSRPASMLAPARRGQGLGRRLYGTLFEALAQEDIHRAYGGITQPNEASNRLHAAIGFEEAGRLAGNRPEIRPFLGRGDLASSPMDRDRQLGRDLRLWRGRESPAIGAPFRRTWRNW